MLSSIFTSPALRSYVYTSVFCLVVSYIAWFAVEEATLRQAMIISFSIGLSINTVTLLLRDAAEQHLGVYASPVALTLLGLIIGQSIGSAIALNDPWALFVANKPALVLSLFSAASATLPSVRERSAANRG